MSGTYALTEHDSKKLLAEYGVHISREVIAHSVDEAISCAESIGFPVVLKLNGPDYMHKTESDGVRLHLADRATVRSAAEELFDRPDKPVSLLVSEHIRSSREFIAGVTRNTDFGLTLAFGLGGIFTEVIADITFRLLPATRYEIRSMFEDLSSKALFKAFRGEPEIHVEELTEVLFSISNCALDRKKIISIDVNPILFPGGHPVAVDALVIAHE
ncbi:MAG: acetate--CoA ligase family protein [Acidimicrobiales bacterium]|nr:acetate--CoA ligase family protein [Acidimicrobiales bacterium]